MTYRPILFLALACLLAPTLSLAQESEPRPTVALSSWKCDWTKLGTIAQLSDSLWVPIEQELVNEGKLTNYGMLIHDWADEWNVVFYRTAVDKTAFFEARAEFGRRFTERHPDAPSLTDYCTEHKDNIYVLRSFTMGATK
ncbi:MAG: hypothetical protein IH853_12135 [Bacteroidetes bacterium]|nr:hypothetical protein [Bacteroidota bacterium]